MLKWFSNFLYGVEAAEFQSSFGLDESIERLRAASKNSLISASFALRESAVGTVTEKRVTLQRVIPFVRNSFKPYFLGHFEVRPEGVFLVGGFTMAPFVKVFMTIWFGLLFLMVAAAVGTGIWKHQEGFVLFPLGAGTVMFSFGVALVGLGKRLSRGDKTWLSTVINGAMLNAPPNPSLQGRRPPTASAP